MSARSPWTCLTLLLAATAPLAAQQGSALGTRPAPTIIASPTGAGLLALAEVGRIGFTVQGAGARATGMGGAFIGVADDATAASHNPAGLAQLRTYEASLVVSQQRSRVAYEGLSVNPGTSSWLPSTQASPDVYQGSASRKVEFVSFTMPSQVGGRNLVTQLSWQSLFDLDQDLAHTADLHDTNYDQHVQDRVRQSGRLGMLTGAVAYELSPRLLAGLSYNRWSGSWVYDSNPVTSVGGVPVETYNLGVSQRLEGQNWNLGLMWRTETVRVGLTYRTGFMGDYQVTGKSQAPNQTTHFVQNTDGVKVRWPWTLGVGASWRVLPQLLLALDWSRTPWSKAMFDAPAGTSLAGRSLFNPFVVNTNTDQAPVLSAPLPPVPDVVTWHMGGEYLFFWGNRIVPVRLGFFREPQPFLDNTTGTTRELKGFTLGVGVKQGPLAFDLAFKHASGSRAAGAPTTGVPAATALGATSLAGGLADFYPFVGTEKVSNDLIKASVIWQFKGEGLRAFFRKVLIGE